ncbi:hypothetical protein DFJ77DRAFT_473199 [Powellomyces hirtus]|nr:hypothetical protein DFJ77DRAFT_473199 [Powellomyces hirtus]
MSAYRRTHPRYTPSGPSGTNLNAAFKAAPTAAAKTANSSGVVVLGGGQKPRLRSTLVAAPKPVDIPSLRTESSSAEVKATTKVADGAPAAVTSGNTTTTTTPSTTTNTIKHMTNTAAAETAATKGPHHPAWAKVPMQVASTASDFPTAAEANASKRYSTRRSHTGTQNATANTGRQQAVALTAEPLDGPHTWVDDTGEMDYSQLPVFPASTTVQQVSAPAPTSAPAAAPQTPPSSQNAAATTTVSHPPAAAAAASHPLAPQAANVPARSAPPAPAPAAPRPAASGRMQQQVRNDFLTKNPPQLLQRRDAPPPPRQQGRRGSFRSGPPASAGVSSTPASTSVPRGGAPPKQRQIVPPVYRAPPPANPMVLAFIKRNQEHAAKLAAEAEARWAIDVAERAAKKRKEELEAATQVPLPPSPRPLSPASVAAQALLVPLPLSLPPSPPPSLSAATPAAIPAAIPAATPAATPGAANGPSAPIARAPPSVVRDAVPSGRPAVPTPRAAKRPTDAGDVKGWQEWEAAQRVEGARLDREREERRRNFASKAWQVTRPAHLAAIEAAVEEEAQRAEGWHRAEVEELTLLYERQMAVLVQNAHDEQIAFSRKAAADAARIAELEADLQLKDNALTASREHVGRLAHKLAANERAKSEAIETMKKKVEEHEAKVLASDLERTTAQANATATLAAAVTRAEVAEASLAEMRARLQATEDRVASLEAKVADTVTALEVANRRSPTAEIGTATEPRWSASPRPASSPASGASSSSAPASPSRAPQPAHQPKSLYQPPAVRNRRPAGPTNSLATSRPRTAAPPIVRPAVAPRPPTPPRIKKHCTPSGFTVTIGPAK